MKHMKIKMILLTIVCALCTLHAPAAEFTVGDFKYKTTGANTCELNKYLGGGGAVTIPSTASDGANSYSVTTIGERAFDDCSSLKDITVGWQTPLVIDSNVFRNVTISAVALHVPSGTEAAYRAADV